LVAARAAVLFDYLLTPGKCAIHILRRRFSDESKKDRNSESKNEGSSSATIVFGSHKREA
jgi:hypothetical protein